MFVEKSAVDWGGEKYDADCASNFKFKHNKEKNLLNSSQKTYKTKNKLNQILFIHSFSM